MWKKITLGHVTLALTSLLAVNVTFYSDAIASENAMPKSIKPDEKAVFKSISMINRSQDYGNLVNGQLASFSGVFQGTVFKAGGAFNCTAALIGPDTLITAAHCVDDGGFPARIIDIDILLDENEDPVVFECVVPKAYRETLEPPRNSVGIPPRTNYDIALCYTKEDGYVINPDKYGIGFEVLDREKKKTLGEHHTVLLGGYGCVSYDYNSFQNSQGGMSFRPESNINSGDGRFRIGDAFVSSLESQYFTSTSLIDDSMAKICPGDSGGPVFSEATVNEVSSRKIIGINSAAGGVPRATASSEGAEITSFFTRVSYTGTDSIFTQYINEYGRKKGKKPEICGLQSPHGCRK